MTNEEKAKEIAMRSLYLSDFPHHEPSVEHGALKMAQWKDEQLKNHEQSLLWTFESILDKIVPDRESYDIAVKEFKNQLINKL